MTFSNQRVPVWTPRRDGTIKVRKRGGCDVGRRTRGRRCGSDGRDKGPEQCLLFSEFFDNLRISKGQDCTRFNGTWDADDATWRVSIINRTTNQGDISSQTPGTRVA